MNEFLQRLCLEHRPTTNHNYRIPSLIFFSPLPLWLFLPFFFPNGLPSESMETWVRGTTTRTILIGGGFTSIKATKTCPCCFLCTAPVSLSAHHHQHLSLLLWSFRHNSLCFQISQYPSLSLSLLSVYLSHSVFNCFCFFWWLLQGWEAISACHSGKSLSCRPWSSGIWSPAPTSHLNSSTLSREASSLILLHITSTIPITNQLVS